MKHQITIMIDGVAVGSFTAKNYGLTSNFKGGSFVWVSDGENREYIKNEPPPKVYRKSETSGTPGS